MSGLQRATRHPDRINDPHHRAHELASAALVDPLGEADAAWLDEHLAGCAPCRATADAFAADAALLRSLRDDLPPVPRDLGARVSAGLDDELRVALRRSGRRRVPIGGASSRRGMPPRRSAAFAGLAAAALIAVLVLPAVLPVGTTEPDVPVAGSFAPAATPIVVDTQPVAWVSRAADGTYVISSAPVDQVCAGADATACGTLDGSATRLGSLDVKPSSVLLGRDGSPAVVVGKDAVYAVPVAAVPHVTSTVPGASPGATNEPAQSPAATGGSATPPADSPPPSVSPSPEPTGTPTPAPTEPGASPSPTSEPATASPEATPSGSPDATASGSPAPTPTATPETTPAPTPAATPTPTLPPATPAPTAAQALAIAESVVLVGAPPAYSPDGKWVAFSARPSDGSHGPDVYAWRVGSKKARLLTDDHASVFSGWTDGDIVASTTRLATAEAGDPAPGRDADPAAVIARSFLVDPVRGARVDIAHDGIWRPVVDPTDRIVVYWTGTLGWDARAHAWLPDAGRLVLADWQEVLDRSAEELRSAALPAAVAGRRIADFEVHFDPAGRRLGVWIGDPADPGTGRLSLVVVDADGSLGKVVLSDTAALPGFSLDAERVAWSTPPGRNGQGSLVTVYAWRGENAGQLYSVPDPGDEPVVVAH